MAIEVVKWHGDRATILDQTRLPDAEEYLEINDYRVMIEAIRELKVRGAPAIGIAAGYALALGAQQIRETTQDGYLRALDEVIAAVNASRPTAVNLVAATAKLRQVALTTPEISAITGALTRAAVAIQEDETVAMSALANHGAALLPDAGSVLTICNSGVLATAAGYGTALGVIVRAVALGKRLSVIACETRPLLQGARLTAWELAREGVPGRLITDGMAATVMAQGEVDLVITGADRIARNGDSANKVGTYGLAVLAHAHGIPFYVAAPLTTVDLDIASGAEIPIEQRDASEVTQFRGVASAPPGFPAINPAFDVTPARYIAAIITERGVIRPPFEEGLSSGRQ